MSAHRHRPARIGCGRPGEARSSSACSSAPSSRCSRRSCRRATRRASRRSPRCATWRSSARVKRVRRIAIGGGCARDRLRAAAPRAVRERRRRGSSILGAILQFIGVFVLGPLFARYAGYGASARRSRGSRASPATLARENAGRNPRRTSITASRADDRGRARRVHHGVRGVGQGVVPRRDRRPDHERLHHQQRRQLRRRSGSARRSAGRSRQLPEIAASSPIRVGTAEVNEQRRSGHRRRPDDRASELFDLNPSAGSLADLGADGVGGLEEVGRLQPLEDRERGPGEVREDRRDEAARSR